MSEDEAFDKLKLLSKREFEILKLYCASCEYKDIASTLFISESAVKNYMGRIYVKLGLDQLPRRARFFAMAEIYCPALHILEESGGFDKETMAVETEPEPISQEMMKKVEDDDGGPLEIIEGETIKFIPPTDKIDPGRRRGPNPFIVGFVIISLIAILFMGYSIYDCFWGTSAAQHGGTTSEIQTQVIADEENATVPTEASQPVVAPTNTDVVPTESPTPEATAPPQADILFEDDFEDGLSDAWEVISGNPIVVNGMLTADQDTWLMVGDPSWENYSIEFDTDSPVGWISQGFNVIGVRAEDIDNMYAYKWAEYEGYSYFVEEGHWSEIPQSEYNVENEGSNLMINVIDGQIALYENGMKATSFFDSRFKNGRIALRIFPEATIDNFKVKEILD